MTCTFISIHSIYIEVCRISFEYIIIDEAIEIIALCLSVHIQFSYILYILWMKKNREKQLPICRIHWALASPTHIFNRF